MYLGGQNDGNASKHYPAIEKSYEPIGILNAEE